MDPSCPQGAHESTLHRQDHDLSQTAKTAEDPGSLDLIRTGSQQLVIGFLSLLVELVKAIVHSVTPLVHLMPALAIYLRVMRSIPTTISFVLSDNIQFVDALGMNHSLPFQNVRGWTAFQSMLSAHFRDRPGGDKVAAGHFRIWKATAQESVLDEATWAEALEPGDRLVMSIEISKMHRTPRRGYCLRANCKGVLRNARSGVLECSLCSLYCHEDHLRPRRRTPPVSGPHDWKAEVAKTHALLEKQGWSKNARGDWVASVDINDRSSPAPRSTVGERRRLDERAIRSKLAECLAESTERARRREQGGWLIKSRDIAQIHQAMAEQMEQEAARKEDRELSLFVRIHIGTDVYKPAISDVGYGQADFEVPTSSPAVVDDLTPAPDSVDPGPVPVSKTLVPRWHRRSLVDIVMEEDSTWAASYIVSAIRDGAEVDVVDPCYGTALQAAAVIGCEVKTSILLQHGADPLAYSLAHQSAIHAAAIYNHARVLAMLLKSCQAGINFDAMGDDDIQRIMLFRSICDSALQAATLRACREAALTLLGYTEEVHIEAALASGDETMMAMIMGEAQRSGDATMEECVDLVHYGHGHIGRAAEGRTWEMAARYKGLEIHL